MTVILSTVILTLMLLAEMRDLAGKTQQNVRDDLGISLATINRHERGKTQLSTLHRLAYASYYGVDPDEIEQPTPTREAA